MIKRNKFGGFTFIELLIAMAIVMIIATIAIPSLRERRVSANEDVATQVLLKDAQFLEKWNTLRGHYSNKDDKSGCPNLPYRFSPESADISSAKYYLNGKHKGSSLNENSCIGNAFTIKAIPICNRGQEGKKSVSLEHDGNIIRGVNPACIDETDIPPDEGNAIDDDNEDGDLNPPFDDETDVLDYCTKHPSIQFCNSKDTCLKYPSLSQCSCVVNPTQERCKKPDPKDCLDKPYLIECQCVDNPTLEACKIIDPNYCTDVAKWTPEQCNPPEDPCATNPDSVACECKIKPTSDKCTQCSIKENSCLTLCGGSGCTPKPTPTPPIPDQIYHAGDEVNSGCYDNTYTCQKDTCSGTDVQNSPDWKLTSCGYFGEKPNPSAANSAESGSKVLTETCNKYICTDNGGGGSSQCSKKNNAPSGLGNSYWTQCYSGKCENPATPTYKDGNIIYNKACKQRVKCENGVACNLDELGPQDGSTYPWLPTGI